MFHCKHKTSTLKINAENCIVCYTVQYLGKARIVCTLLIYLESAAGLLLFTSPLTKKMSVSIGITLVAKLILIRLLIQTLGKMVTKMLLTKHKLQENTFKSVFPESSYYKVLLLKTFRYTMVVVFQPEPGLYTIICFTVVVSGKDSQLLTAASVS